MLAVAQSVADVQHVPIDLKRFAHINVHATLCAGGGNEAKAYTTDAQAILALDLDFDRLGADGFSAQTDAEIPAAATFAHFVYYGLVGGAPEVVSVGRIIARAFDIDFYVRTIGFHRHFVRIFHCDQSIANCCRAELNTGH